MSIKYLSLLPFVALVGCAGSTSSEVETVLSPQMSIENKFVEIISDSFGVVGRADHTLAGEDLYKKSVNGDVITLSSSGTSVQSETIIRTVAYSICSQMGGHRVGDFCVDQKDDKNVHFYAHVQATEAYTATVFAMDQVYAFSVNPDSQSMLEFAINHGYETKEIKEANNAKALLAEKQREDAEKLAAKEKLQAQKRAEQAKVDRLNYLKKLSKTTRSEVLTKGTEICSVYGSAYAPAAYTQDSANGKIEILQSDHLTWDWPSNWYACDVKPQ